ncbi:MAG TPA: hypothetical protein VG826_34290 [Pirellulales bacterium]|nr:hypothetical protein [Pirellulales bacterium]
MARSPSAREPAGHLSRSRVRVLDNSRPSQINTFTEDSTTKTSDDRDVWITVLDGEHAGLTGYTSRSCLRPGK